MRKIHSMKQILIAICIVNSLGIIVGFLVSGHPSIYSETVQVKNTTWTGRVEMPVISQINISTEVSNLDPLPIMIRYEGLRNDNPKLMDIILDSGESYLDTNPLRTMGMSLFSFDRLVIEIIPAANSTSFNYVSIVIQGRNRNLIEWFQYELTGEGFYFISTLLGLIILIPYSFLLFQTYHTRQSRTSWKSELFLRVISFFLLNFGFFLIYTMFSPHNWHKLPYSPILISSLITGIYLIGTTFQHS